MTILFKMIINKIMSYVSHPIVGIMYSLTTPTDIGVIIRANDKVFWARNSSNPTMEESYKIRVYENVWLHKYKVNYISQIQIENKLYEHIHRDTNKDYDD